MAVVQPKPPHPSAVSASSSPKTVCTNWFDWYWRQARKIVVLVIGLTVLALGVVMLALPGPGWVTIFAGLAILATEFAWARWTLKYAKKRAGQLIDAAKQQMGMQTEEPK